MPLSWARSFLPAASDVAAATMLVAWARSLVRTDVDTDAEKDAEEDVEMDAQNGEGNTALHIAVKWAVGDILCEEPLIEELDPEGASMLKECLQHCATRDVEGFDVSELACAQRLHNKDGLMPIHIAAARGNAHAVELLLQAKAPINARSLRRRPIVAGHTCCSWGKRDESGVLTEIAVADKTALHFAVGLLVDQQEMDVALTESDMSLVRLLLRLGADVNAVDFYQQTPLRMAIMGGAHEVVAMLANAGADLSLGCRSSSGTNTALHLATLLKDLRMVELLTGRGAPVDAVGRDGWTPLCLAARQGSADIAKVLLEAHANVLVPSGNGKTPLEIATLNSKRNKSEVVELLQDKVTAAVLEIAFSRARGIASA